MAAITSYPAMKCKMGLWEYYIVKMNMSEIVKEVEFASDLNEDQTLDKAIQRVLNKSRATKQISAYLENREDRFFNSIVVAAYKGNPHFIPAKLDQSDTDSQIMSKSFKPDDFGILQFDDTLKTYALDGQHRLKAI